MRSNAFRLAGVLLALLVAVCGVTDSQQGRQPETAPRVIQRSGGTGAQIQLEQVREFIRANEATKRFGVDGTGFTAAVLDTGIFAAHVDFGRGTKIAVQRNLTRDNGGNQDNALDGHGHGTNVSGIIVANALHRGIAPGARLAVLKVFDNTGRGSFDDVRKALDWIRSPEGSVHRISVVNMSLTAFDNDSGDASLQQDPLRASIAALRAAHIPVVVSAGNAFKYFGKAGMAYPATMRETVSVGSVYDASGGMLKYPDYFDAEARSRAAGQIAPFSQRLHESVSTATRTDIFAPGAPVTATGITDPDTGTSTQQGTSQAAPVTAGVILLMQQFYQRKFPGTLPPVDDVERWLRDGGVTELDGDNEDDNVPHTKLSYPRLDVVRVLALMARELGLAP